MSRLTVSWGHLYLTLNTLLLLPVDVLVNRKSSPAINHGVGDKFRKTMVGASGFEPPTSWSRTRRSSQAEPRPDLSLH